MHSNKVFFKGILKLILGLFIVPLILVFLVLPNVLTPAFGDNNDASFSFQMPHLGSITSLFSGFHPALDIATTFGTDIKPVAEGTVTQAGEDSSGLGLVVMVDHEDGYKSLYAHLSKINVTEGQKITKADVLGKVGLTGRTTGPHTHLEIYKDGERIDPQTVLVQSLSENAQDSEESGVGGRSSQPKEQPKIVASADYKLKELPKTGLPLLAWAFFGLMPLGLKTKGNNSGSSSDKNNEPSTADSIWAQRQYMKIQ